jgi:hypothetical protein
MASSKHDKAQALFDALDPVKTVTAIIDNRAWVTLGFDTFTKAWGTLHASGCNDDRDELYSPAWNMTIQVRAYLAWQMLTEGTPVDVIADLLNTPPGLAEIWERERKIGMTPDCAARVARRTRSAV